MSHARRLEGRVAVVTGGGSGFGAGIVKKFVAEGALVVVADLNLEAALDVAAAAGLAARALRVDVSKTADVQTMLEAAELHFGGIDILVNNAGIGHLPQPLEGLPEDQFDARVAVNMKAIYLAMREVVPRFKARAAGKDGIRGVVLNMASTAGVSPRPRLAWYNATFIRATSARAERTAPTTATRFPPRRPNCAVCPDRWRCADRPRRGTRPVQIGRASCRERV